MSKKEDKKLSSRDVLSKGEKINYELEPVDDGANIDADLEIMNPDELFGDSGGEGQSNPSKELFNPKNPKIKSELTNEEILSMSRLYEMSRKYYERYGTGLLRDALNQMVVLRISKDRGSRKEFVETNREAQKNKDVGMFGRMFGGSGQM